jgi:hypothetical protein
MNSIKKFQKNKIFLKFRISSKEYILYIGDENCRTNKNNDKINKIAIERYSFLTNIYFITNMNFIINKKISIDEFNFIVDNPD